jgi:biotin transport system substrate-specific component
VETTLAGQLSLRVWPQLDRRRRDLALIAGGSLLLAGLAQVRVPLPFSPVPLTGQTLGVLLIGAVLGSRRGPASVGLYLLLGLLGLPVFSGGGSGLAYLSGATGGYLLGFGAAAWLVGRLAERGLERRWTTAWLAFLAGEIVIFLAGVGWLALWFGPQRAVALGLTPFLLGETLKLLLASALLPSAWRLVK